jgi:hypothetical protein
MLRANLFAGSEQHVQNSAGTLWAAFKHAIGKVAIDSEGDLENITKRRTIRFYDTKDKVLDKNSYIFRERCDLETGEREVTLKFRHLDRYVSQDRDMKGASGKGKTKFEEDIKPAFATLFSFSTTQTISETENLTRLKDLALLYPGLPGRLRHYDEEDKLEIINGFTAREIVVVGARFQIGKEPRLDSDCAVIAWYNHKSAAETPVVVEFSFKYGNKNGEYEREVAERCYRVFEILLRDLTTWIDPNSRTKTAFVYR